MNPTIRILVVEDNEKWQKLLCDMYKEILPLAKVIPVSIGRDALAYLENDKFDLLSVDIDLSGTDNESEGRPDPNILGANGYDIIIKASEQNACKAVIVITGALTNKKLLMVIKDEGIRRLVRISLNNKLEKLFPGDRHIVLPKVPGATEQDNIDYFKSMLPREKLLSWCNAFYEFYKMGANWKITFNGVSKEISHQKGFYYIQYLLQNKKVEFQSSRLYELLSPPRRNETLLERPYVKNKTEEEALSRDDKTMHEGLGVIKKQKMDHLSVKQIEDMIEYVKQNKDNASTQNEKSTLEDQIDKMEDYLKRSRNWRGYEVNAADEKARQKVYKAYDKCLKAIEKEHKDFHEHLKKHIIRETGTSYKYDPPDDIYWKLE